MGAYFFYKILFVQNSQKYFFLKFYRIMFICNIVLLNRKIVNKNYILCLFLYNPYIKYNILTHHLVHDMLFAKRKTIRFLSKKVNIERGA